MVAAFALHFTNLLFSGALAGSELGIHYGVGAPPPIISDTASIQIRQAAGRRLRILIPALFLAAAITGVSVAFSSEVGVSAWLRWAALLCLAVWVATRVLVTVPINSAVLDWSAISPPAGWEDRIALAERFHILGVWAAISAYGLLLAAELLRTGSHV